MAKSSVSRVAVGIYRRDQPAEHNSPGAWKAHKLRAKVFDKAVKHKSLKVVTVRDFYDEENTHEFADAVIEILKEPTTQIALTAAGLYVFKHLTKPLDNWVEAGVKRIYKSLFGAFQKKEINEFFLQLPNGDNIKVGPDANVTITVANGKVRRVELEEVSESPKPKGKQPKKTRR